jgi:hypothetical protein
MLMRRAALPEVGAVYRFPSKRFFMVHRIDGAEVVLQQVDVNAMRFVPGGDMQITLANMALGRLAWHASEWRVKVAAREVVCELRRKREEGQA